jgi:hypothetical protein
MIKIGFGKLKFNLIDRWSELSLERFIELSEIEIPAKLMELYNLSAKLSIAEGHELEALTNQWNQLNESITFEDNVKTFPEYYGKVIFVLSDANIETIDHIPSETREQIYSSVLKGFVLSLLYLNPVDMINGEIKPYTPASMDDFLIDNQTFLFPGTLKIMGEKVKFAREPIISFAEACDIDIVNNTLATEGIKKLPLFMAIYCRRKGESYSEMKVLERTELMQRCSMDIVWALFFYIGKSMQKFMIDTILSLKVPENQAEQALIMECVD